MKTRTIKLDFDSIRKWRDPENDNLPAYSMLTFYKAAGILDAVRELNGEKPVAFCDILSCNWPTHRKIKDFLEETWRIFSLRHEGTNKVVWNTDKYPKGTQHWARNISKKVKGSVERNFLDYCPFIDDSFDDDDVVDDVIKISVREESDNVVEVEEVHYENKA